MMECDGIASPDKRGVASRPPRRSNRPDATSAHAGPCCHQTVTQMSSSHATRGRGQVIPEIESVRVKIRRVVAAAVAVVGAALAPLAVAAAEVSGAGATFPYPIYAKWAEAYKKESGVAVNYQPIGSGEGIRQIQSKEVTFGATDMPLAAGDLGADDLVQFPTVMGGIAVVINVEGVKSAELRLDGLTVAR